MNRERLHDLDRVKGLAIFLVVVGHIVAGRMPRGDIWFHEVKMILYTFHMPLFMFVSGLVYGYTRKAVDSWKD